MPLPIKDRATALNKSSPISFFALYDWIILNLFMVVFQPLGRLGYLLVWIEGGLEIETLYLVFGPISTYTITHMVRLARISISSFRYQASPE